MKPVHWLQRLRACISTKGAAACLVGALAAMGAVADGPRQRHPAPEPASVPVAEAERDPPPGPPNAASMASVAAKQTPVAARKPIRRSW